MTNKEWREYLWKSHRKLYRAGLMEFIAEGFAWQIACMKGEKTEMTIEKFEEVKAVVQQLKDVEASLSYLPDRELYSTREWTVATCFGTVEFTKDEARAVFKTMRTVLEERKAKILKELEAL